MFAHFLQVKEKAGATGSNDSQRSAFREYDPARDQNTSSGPVSLRAGDANRTVAITAVPRSPALAVGLAAWTNGFSDMTDLGKSVQLLLAQHFHADRPLISRRQDSTDGTIKWLIKLIDGQEAETVYIPDSDRGTLCISSQVGCTLTCSFCHTGTQRLVRNLSVDEICGQVLLAMDELGDWPAGKPDRRLTNIVLMGMGEPLYNYNNVAKALQSIMSGEGIALSRRRVTLSTSGIVPEIQKCGEELGVNLAISLHAVRDELRDQLVPINRKYNLKSLIDAVRAYPGLSNARRVTWEYVMLAGVNDSEADAKALVQLIKGIPSKINLIPFNPWPGTSHQCSDDEALINLQKSSCGQVMLHLLEPLEGVIFWQPAVS